jgi:hypothetical protein
LPAIRIFSRRVKVPSNRVARSAIGGGLIFGGVLGFLPVLGYWMIPAGLLVLAIDSPRIRRFNRRATVKLVRAWNNWRRKPSPTMPDGSPRV